MYRYWYDCEFLDNGRTIELISIGIVASDGRELYVVNAEVNDGPLYEKICDHDWLMTNVVPHLPLADRKDRIPPVELADRSRRQKGRFDLDMGHLQVLPLWVIRNQVRQFLTAGSDDYHDNELWAYYGAYDHVALAQLFGPMSRLPKGIPMFTHELVQLWEAAGQPTKPDKQDEHHALADARWNRELWKRCTGA